MLEEFFADRQILADIPGQPLDWSVAGFYQWAVHDNTAIDWHQLIPRESATGGFHEWAHTHEFWTPSVYDPNLQGMLTIREIDAEGQALWTWAGYEDPNSPDLYNPWMEWEKFEQAFIEHTEGPFPRGEIGYITHLTTIVVDEQNGQITGLDINDIIFMGDGRDDINGFAGDDVIDAGDGINKIVGGRGIDLLFGGEGIDNIQGGAGDDADWIDGGNGRNALYGDLDGFRINDDFGGDDVLLGGDDRDEIWGGGGDDYARAGDGFDVIYGGQGNDYIDAGGDDDAVSGEGGDDDIVAGPGDDVIWGHSDPSLWGADPGEQDADSINGGAGDDTIDAGPDADHIDAGPGDNAVIGGAGTDTFILRLDEGAGDSITTVADYKLDEWIQIVVPGGIEGGGVDLSIDTAVIGDTAEILITGQIAGVQQAIKLQGLSKAAFQSARDQELTILDHLGGGSDLYMITWTTQETMPFIPDGLLMA